MRLPLFLTFVGASAAFYIPSHDEKVAAWQKLNVVKDLNDGVPDGYKLVLASPLWRHGDRGPTEPFVGDVLTEDDWDFGGGGYGELSPIGMEQHFNLGSMLYDRYADGGKFLSQRYRAKEIYAIATDRNRTMISAVSNFAGMYSRAANAIKGTDYPDIQGWPATFIPVPVHTDTAFTNHVADPDAGACDRQKDLWALAHQHPEYVNYAQKTRTVQTLDYLRDKTGANEDELNFDKLYILRQGMLCESIHFADNFSTWYPWYTEDVVQRVNEIDNQNIDFEDGIFGSGWINGYDLTLEIPRIRGGELINNIVGTANGVLDCYASDQLGERTRCTDNDHFLKNLKYYVISAHDSTISAYLTVLEAKMYVLQGGGYPSYSSAVITEFFIDTTTGSNERYFRLLFHDNDQTGFRVITPMVTGCEIGSDFCRMTHLQALADKYKAPLPIEEWCAQRVNGNADTTTVAPPPPASTGKTAAPGTTQTAHDDTTTKPPAPAPTTSTSAELSIASALFSLIFAALFV